LGFIPAFIWNWQNDFETFKHLLAMNSTEGANTKPFTLSIASKSFFEYLKGQW